MPAFQIWGDVGEGFKKVTDVIAKTEEGRREHVETVSQLVGLLRGSHSTGGGEALEINGDSTMCVYCLVFGGLAPRNRANEVTPGNWCARLR